MNLSAEEAADQAIPAAAAGVEAGISPAMRVDAQGRLDQDAACQRCGYNLRGLVVSGRCPECDHPVRESVRGDELAYADRAWVRRVRQGVLFKLWAVLGGWGLVMVFGVVAAIWPVMEGPAAIMAMLAGLASIGATWMIAAPDPGQSESESRWSWRRLALVGAAVSMPLAVLEAMDIDASAVIAPGAGGMVAGPFGSINVVVIGLYVVLALVSLLHHLLLLHAADLARRGGRPGLSPHCRLACWGQVIGGAIVMAGLIPVLVLIAFEQFPAAIGVGVLMGLGMLAAATFGIWEIVVWFLFLGMLKPLVGSADPPPPPVPSR